MLSEVEVTCDESNFIAKGTHKETYRHPYDPSLCIKVPCGDSGKEDLYREIEYRTLRAKRGLASKILPEYHGVVDTNLGEGHVFELIQDYDGAKSMTMEDYAQDEASFIEDFDKLLVIMLKFKRALFKERVITMELWLGNLIVQKISATKSRIMLINDMGSEVAIPLEYHIDFFANKKILRRWTRFVEYANKAFPSKTMSKFIDLLR